MKYINNNVNNSDNLEELLDNGWQLDNTGATSGDNPSFRLFKQHNISETHYDNPLH